LRSIGGLVGSFGASRARIVGSRHLTQYSASAPRRALFFYTERCSAVVKHATQRPEDRQLMWIGAYPGERLPRFAD
jgi:hypothetical protein